MAFLKRTLIGSLALFLVAVSILIAGIIFYETNWFRSSTSLLCNADGRNLSWNVTVAEKDQQVSLLSSRSAFQPKVTVSRYTDTLILLSWPASDGATAFMSINRLDNSFNMWLQLDDSEKERATNISGTCSVRLRNF